MKVKVCGMREARNIAKIASLEPDYMGFIFYEHSPRFAGGLAPEALDVLQESVKRVGVFVDAPEKFVRETAVKYRLDGVQLHGSETPETCRRLRDKYMVIKAFGIENAADFEQTAAYEGACDYFLFDTKTILYGGSGMQFNHALLADYHGTTPYFLSGGLGAEDGPALARIRDPRCAAVDVNSRFETAPGVKDPGEVKALLSFFRNA